MWNRNLRVSKKIPSRVGRGEREISLFDERFWIPTQFAPKFVPRLFLSVGDRFLSTALLHCETVVRNVTTHNKIRCIMSIIEELVYVVALFQIILDRCNRVGSQLYISAWFCNFMEEMED